ncbi:MAG TPA: hypothetical protein VF017_17790 [Thermoanaerobaculia bacterium]|nr:hypothetical protein [Thermoanaerobaculia bacterium]
MPSFRSRVIVVLLSLGLVAAALPARAGAWNESSDVFGFLARWFSVLSKDGCWPDPTGGPNCKAQPVTRSAPPTASADKDGCWPDPTGKPQCPATLPAEKPGARASQSRPKEN